ncbi:MAG: exodeoxyribonuclease VII small subunit [Anaeroplasmataceae bacterium]
MNDKSFEELLKQLNDLVDNLETNNMSLEESVKAYIAGVELSKKCYEILDSNEKQIVEIMDENGLTSFKGK